MDAHIHGLKKDQNGNVIDIGAPRPGPDDRTKNLDLYPKPQAVLGYIKNEIPPDRGGVSATNTPISTAAPKYRYERYIGFYLRGVLLNQSNIKFSDFKQGVHRINKKRNGK